MECLWRVMDHGISRFTDAETAFPGEYTSVMKPMRKKFMGYLPPTLSILREKLVQKQATAVACRPIITALLNGINKRFAAVYDNKEAIAAAILHPKFRKTWTNNQRLIDTGIQYIRGLLTGTSSASAAAASGSRQVMGTSAELKNDDDFFSNRSNMDTSDTVDVLAQYLQNTSDDTACVSAWPVLNKLFVRLNTPLPASAASERLFSCAGIVMNSRRTRMSDALFEELVLLKQNKAVTQ